MSRIIISLGIKEEKTKLEHFSVTEQYSTYLELATHYYYNWVVLQECGIFCCYSMLNGLKWQRLKIKIKIKN